MLLKSIFRRNVAILLKLSNSYQANTKFNHRIPYQTDNGYLTESQWFARRNVNISPTSVDSDAKIIEQQLTMKCNDVKYKTWDKFSNIEHLDSRLAEVLMKLGHDDLTPIQKHTFDILNKQIMDVLGSAETGSGKTIAFLAPIFSNLLKQYPSKMMNEIKENSGSTQFPLFLVLAPTRELVQQIAAESRKLLRLTHMKVVDIIGGVPANAQILKIGNGCHSLIATPGRLIDLTSRGILSLKYCNQIVLDEADRMLDMGFEPQIQQIVRDFDMPQEVDRHTSMFSATFPDSVLELAQTLMKPDYGRIMIGRHAGSSETSIPESISQEFAMTSSGALLRDCFDYLGKTNKKTIVFCNRKSDVDMFSRFAWNQKLPVAALHGDFSQQRRQNELHMFKKNEVKVLVATAVAARGIDVADVECVVNMGLPLNIDEYMHRVGRCGRMGRAGQAMTFVLDRDLAGSNVKDLIKMLRRTDVEVPDILLQDSRYQGSRKSFGNYQRPEFKRGNPAAFDSSGGEQRFSSGANFRKPYSGGRANFEGGYKKTRFQYGRKSEDDAYMR